MRPAIRSGDRVVIGPIDGQVLRIDDIVVWSQRRRVVIHRVVALLGNELRTRGDANAYDDEWVSRRAVIGRVVRSEPQPLGLLRVLFRRLAPHGRRLLETLGKS
ncbi:MAG: hypothetical protein HY901_16085 [Deltaproteobacteria bacterium]|nr:hypothetical protein [Deltaproteobacteria bacterium]